MSNRDDYIEVHDRIKAFYAKYPKGSLQQQGYELMHVGERTFLAFTALAYRTPDDERPGIGTAWEPVPGPTSFTRDSEMQNAETSAWGRAIAALGFEVRNGIATKEDVEKAQAAAKPTGDEPKKLTEPQRKKIFAVLRELDRDFPPPHPCADWKTHLLTVTGKDIKELTRDQAGKAIDAMEKKLATLRAEKTKELQDQAAEAPDDDIPF